MAGGVVSLISNVFKAAVLSRNGVVIALLLSVTSYGLAVYARPTESTTEFNAARAVTDLQCVGWNTTGPEPRQRLIVGNGSSIADGDTVDVSIGDRMKSLTPGNSRETDLKTGKAKRISAEGDSANRIAALMTAQRTSGMGTGLAVDACRTPGQEWWFSGINTQAGYSAYLVLTNPDNADTVANLTAYSSQGETSMTEFQRVLVPAQSLKLVDITRAVPGEKSVAIRVNVVDGRVTASMQTEVVDGAAQLGRTYNMPVESLSTRTVIVGIRDSIQSPMLHLVSPNEDAIASVILHTPDGSFPVSEATDINLDAGVVKVLDLKEVLNNSKASIEIVSDQPVAASVSLFARFGGILDYQILSAQSALLRGAVTMLPSELKLAGLQALSLTDAKVTVTAYLRGEQQWQVVTSVREGEVAALRLEDERESGTVLVITSDEPEVYVTMWLEDKTSRGSHSAATALLDPSSQTVSGVRLMLRTS